MHNILVGVHVCYPPKPASFVSLFVPISDKTCSNAQAVGVLMGLNICYPLKMASLVSLFVHISSKIAMIQVSLGTCIP